VHVQEYKGALYVVIHIRSVYLLRVYAVLVRSESSHVSVIVKMRRLGIFRYVAMHDVRLPFRSSEPATELTLRSYVYKSGSRAVDFIPATASQESDTSIPAWQQAKFSIWQKTENCGGKSSWQKAIRLNVTADKKYILLQIMIYLSYKVSSLFSTLRPYKPNFYCRHHVSIKSTPS